MSIEIAERLKPFSHLLGTSTILPGIGYQVQIFPCLIRVYHLKESIPVLLTEVELELTGPVQQFTVCNDLEKGRVSVWGKTANGWMRYHLISAQQTEGVRLVADRVPSGGLKLRQRGKDRVLQKQEGHDLIGESMIFTPYQLPPCDRLSLGHHKAQEGELMRRRLCLAEILPFWHRLGQLVPAEQIQNCQGGTLALLDRCRQCLQHNKPEETEQAWVHLILAGFSSLFVPRLEDTDYQGLTHPLSSCTLSPLVLLSEGACLIRQLFVQQEQEQVRILPHLLPSLPSGRLIQVPLAAGGWISLEWTKKVIRRLVIYAAQDQTLLLQFRSNVRSYRLYQHTKDKGTRQACASFLSLKKNCYYFFDNFN